MATLMDIVKKGSINRSASIRIIDSTDGTPELGVVFNTSGIDLWYRREGAALSSITEVTLASLTTAHADGGFLHISDAEYRLDLPDAAFATGANYVDIGGTVTGMVVIGGRIRLVDYDLEDSGGGSPTVVQIRQEMDSNSTQLAAIVADTNELQTDWVNGGRLDLIIDIIAADTTTDIPALIATAQSDLDIITGADGATLLSATQSSIDAIETDTGTTLPATLSIIDGIIDTILVDTANMQPKLGTPATDISADIAGVKVDTAATLVDTAVIGAAGAGLTDLGGMSTGMKAEVNAEVVDVMDTDTVTLPGQIAPPLAPTRTQMWSWIYKVFRNRKSETATQWSLYADNETTVDSKATTSDDGTTGIKQKIVSGP